MKTIYILLLTLVFTPSFASNDETTPRVISDLEKKELKGDVKYLVEINNIDNVDTMYCFSKSGYITEVFAIAANKQKTRTAKYNYAPDNTTLISIDYFVGDKTTNKTIEPIKDSPGVRYRFDDKGNVIKITRQIKPKGETDIQDNNSREVINYTYNNKNKTVSVEKTLFGLIPTNRSSEISFGIKEYWLKKYTYNNNGIIKTIKTLNQDKELVEEESFTYTYDARNNWTVKTSSAKNASKKRTIEYYSVLELRFDYGTYTGSIKNGKANGKGKMVYTKQTQISRFDRRKRKAEAGQYIIGTWYNNNLDFGKLYDKNGKFIQTIMIGRAE